MPSPILSFALEDALVNYVSGQMVATGVNDVNYYKGITFSGVYQLPAVMINCSSAKRAFPNANLYNASMTFDYVTQVDSPNAEQTHNANVGYMRDILGNHCAIKAALNPPASGIDTRVEPSLYLYGMVELEEKAYIVAADQRSIGQMFNYRIDCSN